MESVKKIKIKKLYTAINCKVFEVVEGKVTDNEVHTFVRPNDVVTVSEETLETFGHTKEMFEQLDQKPADKTTENTASVPVNKPSFVNDVKS